MYSVHYIECNGVAEQRAAERGDLWMTGCGGITLCRNRVSDQVFCLFYRCGEKINSLQKFGDHELLKMCDFLCSFRRERAWLHEFSANYSSIFFDFRGSFWVKI